MGLNREKKLPDSCSLLLGSAGQASNRAKSSKKATVLLSFGEYSRVALKPCAAAGPACMSLPYCRASLQAMDKWAGKNWQAWHV
jgi:hypothetical protein